MFKNLFSKIVVKENDLETSKEPAENVLDYPYFKSGIEFLTILINQNCFRLVSF